MMGDFNVPIIDVAGKKMSWAGLILITYYMRYPHVVLFYSPLKPPKAPAIYGGVAF